MMFALVDCNNFYVSCERVFQPGLNGKPVVVLSNNDGCVISRSNEAKTIGVPMGAPAFEYRTLFSLHNVTVFSANFALYGNMSQRVMSILKEFNPEIEIYSIDEAFLKINDPGTDLAEFGRSVRDKILKWTGIPTSVGIAPTKALAKAANLIAKKFPERTGNVHIIGTEEQRVKALKWMKVEDVWGIGRRLSKRLKAAGVATAFDFTMLDSAWVKKNMAVVGLRLQKDLLGTPVLDLEAAQFKKNIATTRSFEKDYTNPDEIKERVVTFAVSCAEKLRRQHSCCLSLMVFINTNRNKKDLPQYNPSIVLQLPFPTNSNIELAKFAGFAFNKIYREGFHYKRAGVIVQDFVPEDAIQQTLFDKRDERHIPLMQAIDRLNSAYGDQKIRLASQDLDRVWKMRQERLSPRYTTRLSEILTIYCREK